MALGCILFAGGRVWVGLAHIKAALIKRVSGIPKKIQLVQSSGPIRDTVQTMTFM